MYQKAYGIIETLAPLHVGASAGEETGNLNLIFRDQFTQTGIIPGSSIRGRFRADMRLRRQQWLEQTLQEQNIEIPEEFPQYVLEANGREQKINRLAWLEEKAEEQQIKVPKTINEHYWYGASADGGDTTEALIKFEYASLVWLPVFCPGQPVVWISCPRLLKRYKKIANIKADVPNPYTICKGLTGRKSDDGRTVLFFNLGFIVFESKNQVEQNVLKPWVPPGADLQPDDLVIVGDKDISMLHDMALFRQSRVRLSDTEKKVDGGGFFNVEALPEGSILAFPVAKKENDWQPFSGKETEELYFGGLESIGFGHCSVTLNEVKTNGK
ncbi:MAG: RAMP superfamily CRISPR-associated protein [Leptolyngbyaceae bacterium]|nr:RAMP superfamily CRISPR-associated protein [Leptolyngbyaceae bacterium]